jgi:hypothetical protein
MSTPTNEPAAANVELHIPLDDPHLRHAIEAFADGPILGMVEHDGELQLDLILPGAWPAAISAAEQRLDRLDINWRETMRLRRP